MHFILPLLNVKVGIFPGIASDTNAFQFPKPFP